MNRLIWSSTNRLLAVLCVLATPAWADPDARSVTAALEKINAAVKKESRALSATETRLSSLEQEEAGYEKQAKETEIKLASLESEISHLESEKASLAVEIANLDAESRRAKALSLKRIRVLYTQKTGSVLERLLEQRGSSEFDRSTYYLSKLRQYDRQLIDRVIQLKEENTLKIDRLESKSQELDQLKQDLQSENRQLEYLTQKQKPLIVKLKSEKKSRESSLASLQDEAHKLEKIVVSLTGGGGVSPVPRETREPGEGSVVVSFGPDEALAGKGLSAENGNLLFPVGGQVLRSYGRYQVDEFSDFVYNKGVEMTVSPGVPIRAIADGRIMYAGKMPGYGSVVIVDHGERYYSLYGCLGDLSVSVGEAVKAGQGLAVAGQPDKRGRSFYFEIRKNGAPVNPQEFYSRPVETLAQSQ